MPSAVARSLPSTGLILLVWTLTGVLSFFGALAYAELGAMLPTTGGQYVYLREAYGPLVGFLSDGVALARVEHIFNRHFEIGERLIDLGAPSQAVGK